MFPSAPTVFVFLPNLLLTHERRKNKTLFGGSAELSLKAPISFAKSGFGGYEIMVLTRS